MCIVIALCAITITSFFVFDKVNEIMSPKIDDSHIIKVTKTGDYVSYVHYIDTEKGVITTYEVRHSSGTCEKYKKTFSNPK